jgi:hypothetical protein
MYCLQGYLYQTVDTQNWQGRLGPGRPVRPVSLLPLMIVMCFVVKFNRPLMKVI